MYVFLLNAKAIAVSDCTLEEDFDGDWKFFNPWVIKLIDVVVGIVNIVVGQISFEMIVGVFVVHKIQVSNMYNNKHTFRRIHIPYLFIYHI